RRRRMNRSSFFFVYPVSINCFSSCLCMLIISLTYVHFFLKFLVVEEYSVCAVLDRANIGEEKQMIFFFIFVTNSKGNLPVGAFHLSLYSIFGPRILVPQAQIHIPHHLI